MVKFFEILQVVAINFLIAEGKFSWTNCCMYFAFFAPVIGFSTHQWFGKARVSLIRSSQRTHKSPTETGRHKKVTDRRTDSQQNEQTDGQMDIKTMQE